MYGITRRSCGRTIGNKGPPNPKLDGPASGVFSNDRLKQLAAKRLRNSGKIFAQPAGVSRLPKAPRLAAAALTHYKSIQVHRVVWEQEDNPSSR
jgi:hypothetical protein